MCPTTSPTAAETPALSVRGLVKRFGDFTAVNGIDLSFPRGRVFGLLGPNGAGKTTTIKMLEGLIEADEGEIELLGLRWGAGRDAAIRQRIGVQLQDAQVGDKSTVFETVRLFRSFYERGRRLDEVLDLVALQEKRDTQVHQLSGGQRQRLTLACALVGDPDLLFLDEPTTGLDPAARRRLWDIVQTFRAQGGSVLITTHYMDEAEILCDDLAILDRGEVIARGAPRALIAGLGASQRVSLTTDRPLGIEDLAELPGVSDVLPREDGIDFGSESLADSLPALTALLEQRGARLERLSTHEATLEDVFLSLTGRGLRED
jgi:ABC-2 type transport system ATP-binding protein